MLLPFALLLLVAGSVYAGGLTPGYWYLNNITVRSGYVLVDVINTTAPIHLFILPRSEYSNPDFTQVYNRTLGSGTYVIRLNPDSYSVVTENSGLKNLTVHYYLATVPLPSYIFNGASLTYAQTGTTILKLFGVTPSQKTAIDDAIAKNASLAAEFENYTESYSNGDISFTKESAGTTVYTLSRLNIVNGTVNLTVNVKCGPSRLPGGEVNLCLPNSGSMKENLSQAFSGNTTELGGISNSTEMAQLRNGTYSTPGANVSVQPNRSVTVPAGTFNVYHVNVSATQSVQGGGSESLAGQAWIDSASGTVDKVIFSTVSFSPRSTTSIGGWNCAFSLNSTIAVSLAGANITEAASTTSVPSTTIISNSTGAGQANQSSSSKSSDEAVGVIFGFIVLICIIYALYRLFAWLLGRIRGKPAQESQKTNKADKKQ